MVEILVLIIVVLQLLDIYTTDAILDLGGKELNPVLDKFFKIVGVLPGLLISKTIFVGVLFYYYITNRNLLVSTEGILTLIAISAIYSYIVRNNFKVLNSLKSSSN
jgi:hypothetical protein